MIDEIKFGKEFPSLDDYENIPWKEGDSKLVNFFEDKQVLVKLVSIENSNLDENLNFLIDGSGIAVDCEWKPDDSKSNNPIALFQFCSSKGVLLVHNTKPSKNEVMLNFLNNNSFFAKGMSCDRKKLKSMFDTPFEIEDIQETWLKPYKVSINFEQMVETLVGAPAAQFKDKHISRSDWSQTPLSVKQVLYASFDAYGLYLSYQKLKEQFKEPGVLKPKEKKKSKKNRADKKKQRKKYSKTFHPRFDTDVPFRGPELFIQDRRKEKIYIPQHSLDCYSHRHTMVIFMRNKGYIEGNRHCNLCNIDFTIDEKDAENEFPEVILEHCWNCHSDLLVSLYFPLQTEKFQKKIAQEVALGNLTQKRLDNGHYLCSICNKESSNMHIAFTHVRLDHYSKIREVNPPPIKQLACDYLVNYGSATKEPPMCLLCMQEFNNEDELIDHVWIQHGETLPEIWKHRPTNYDEDTCKECLDLGITAINDFIYGEIAYGIITCWDCRIGFDSPYELFIHLFHKHICFRVLFHRDIPSDFPFMVANLPEELYLIVQRFCQKNTEMEMEIAEIYSQKAGFYGHCNECNLDFDDEDEAFKHFAHNHLVFMFVKGKPINLDDC